MAHNDYGFYLDEFGPKVQDWVRDSVDRIRKVDIVALAKGKNLALLALIDVYNNSSAGHFDMHRRRTAKRAYLTSRPSENHSSVNFKHVGRLVNHIDSDR